jgi:prepilin-type N-terminal cleavage/methylation domain-containing protein
MGVRAESQLDRFRDRWIADSGSAHVASRVSRVPNAPRVFADPSPPLLGLSRCRSSDPGSAQGVSLVELLVCLAIIATLVTLLMPAIQSVRAGMARAKCGDHKRQLGLALEMYMEAARGLPPPNPSYPGGWAREVLPFMEERPLFEALDLRQPLAAPANAAAAHNRPPLMQCTFAPWRESTVAGVAPSDFLLVVSAFKPDSPEARRPGPRQTKDFGFYFFHAPQDSTAAWPASVEVDRSVLHERMAEGTWAVWHPSVPKTGLGSITDDGL